MGTQKRLDYSIIIFVYARPSSSTIGKSLYHCILTNIVRIIIESKMIDTTVLKFLELLNGVLAAI